MKGTKVGDNLYKLMANTNFDGATFSTEDNTNEDEYQLWNMRLGYLSEKGMLELYKRLF